MRPNGCAERHLLTERSGRHVAAGIGVTWARGFICIRLKEHQYRAQERPGTRPPRRSRLLRLCFRVVGGVSQDKHETLGTDDLEQPRWKRPRCLLCPAIASVSADRIDAPESSRAVISAWLLDCRRTDSLGSLVRGSGGPTRPVCGRWLGLRGSRQGHILRGSSARQSEYLTVRKPRPRRRVVSHERGGVCEACSVWRWWSCFWRLAGK